MWAVFRGSYKLYQTKSKLTMFCDTKKKKALEHRKAKCNRFMLE